jgi:hypothetical protein
MSIDDVLNSTQLKNERMKPRDVPMPTAQAKPAEAASTPDDPRVRAALRAAELRSHLGNLDEDHDKFYIDPRIIPDGWSYEWKRHSVMGKEDASYAVVIANRGWEPVPANRHPELMPRGYRGESILNEGLILCERPKEITDEVKRLDYARAVNRVRDKEAQLRGAPPGTLPRDNKGDPLVQIKKEYEYVPMQIPKDAA